MPLVYLPDRERLFSWSLDHASELALLGEASEEASAALLTPEGHRVVEGRSWPLRATAEALALRSQDELARAPASVLSWALASKLALELVARERVVPTIARRAERYEARWVAVLSGEEHAAKVSAIARSMPPAAHAVPVGTSALPSPAVWAPEALLRAYLDAVVDGLVRRAALSADPGRADRGAWDQRFRHALSAADPAFEPRGFAERGVVDELARWSAPLGIDRDRLRTGFRLELPEGEDAAFTLRFFVQSPEDASLRVSATDVWSATGRRLSQLGRAFRDAEESLLAGLGRAVRLFEPLSRALAQPRPEALSLDPAEAFAFLSEGAPRLTDAGFFVIVPAELTATGERRLRLRMRVGGGRKVAGAVAAAAGLSLDELLEVDWEAVIGEQAISARELAALAAHKATLVRHRGTWIALDPRELAAIRARIAEGPRLVEKREAIALALAGETRHADLPVAVVATGTLAALLARVRAATSSEVSPPATLRAALRPYQQRGLSWLSTMASLALGACLADDMGLDGDAEPGEPPCMQTCEP